MWCSIALLEQTHWLYHVNTEAVIPGGFRHCRASVWPMICKNSTSSPTIHPWSPMSLSRLREGLPSASKAFREHISISSRLCKWVEEDSKKKTEFISIYYTLKGKVKREKVVTSLWIACHFSRFPPVFAIPYCWPCQETHRVCSTQMLSRNLCSKSCHSNLTWLGKTADTQLWLVDLLNSDVNVQQSTCEMGHWSDISISVLRCHKL